MRGRDWAGLGSRFLIGKEAWMRRCGILSAVFLFLFTGSSFPMQASVEELLPYSPVIRQQKVVAVGTIGGPVLLIGAGDLDGDGAVDIVFCRGGQVFVLPGEGDGRFSGPEPLWSYEGEALMGGLSDLDGDGDVDLFLLVRRKEGDLLYLLSNEDGALHHEMELVLPWEPHWILSGDWDGDGEVDLALLRRGEGYYVEVFLVRGLGGWGFGEPEFLFRADGLPVGLVGDVLVLRLEDGAYAVDFSGEKVGKVVVKGSAVFRVLPADLDLDGQGDLVLATSLGAFVAFREGEVWGVPRQVWEGKATDAVAGDFNGDGYPDLLVRRGGSGEWGLLANRGNKELVGPAGEVLLPAPRSLLTADLDGNGTTDLVLDYLYGIVVAVSGGSPVGESWLPMGGSALIGVGDLSGDGRPELVVWGRDGFEVLWNNGRGGFIRERLADVPGITPLVARVSEGRIFILEVDENGMGGVSGISPQGEALFRWELGQTPAPALVVEDLDGDGELDLLCLGPEEILVFWGLESLRTYRWRRGELSLAVSAGDEVYLVSTAEYAEVYRVSFPGRRLRVEGPLLRLESIPLAMGAGDLDEDGSPDVVLGCLRLTQEGNGIQKGTELGLILSRLGTKVLVPELPAGEVPLPLNGIAVGDFDGDGFGDLALSTAGGSGAYLLFGDGQGNFAPRVPAGPPGYVPPALEGVGPVFAADLDGDGTDELVASTVGLGPFLKVLWGGGGG